MKNLCRVLVVSIVILSLLTISVFSNEDEGIKLTPVFNLTGHSSGVSYIEFNSSGEKLISCSDTGMFLWDMETAIGKKIDDGSYLTCDSTFSPDSNYIISCAEYGYVNGHAVSIYDAKRGEILDSFMLYADEGSHSPYIDKKNLPATALGISNDSKTVIIGCDEHRFNPYSSIRYYDLELKKEVYKYNVEGYIKIIKYHPNKDVFAHITSGVSENGYATITVRDKETSKIIMSVQDEFQPSGFSYYDLKFSPNGKYLAVLSYGSNGEGQLLIFDTENDYTQIYSDNSYDLKGNICFSNDNKLLIVDRKIYSLENGIELLNQEFSNGIDLISPNDKYIAITDRDIINIYKADKLFKRPVELNILLEKNEMTLDTTQEINCILKMSDGTEQKIENSNINWYSDNVNIAIIDGGKVYPRGIGEAKITAEKDNLKAEINIKVIDTPIKLTASTSNQAVHLKWEPVKANDNLIGYYLYRSKESGKYDNLTVTDFPINDTTYTDKNVENNEVYYYIVKAIYKDKQQSQASNEVSVKPQEGKENITIELQVNNPIMKVNGENFEIDPGRGTKPQILNGRTVIPIRAFIEAMQGEVEWDSDEQKISISSENNYIELWLNKKDIRVNSKEKEMDIAPQVIDGRTMVPVRFVAENLGYDIEWNITTQSAIISKK